MKTGLLVLLRICSPVTVILMMYSPACADLFYPFNDDSLNSTYSTHPQRNAAASKGMWEWQWSSPPPPRTLPALAISPVHVALAVKGGTKGKLLMWRDGGDADCLPEGVDPCDKDAGFQILELDNPATRTCVSSVACTDCPREMPAWESGPDGPGSKRCFPLEFLNDPNPGCGGNTFLPDGRLLIAGGRYQAQRFCA